MTTTRNFDALASAMGSSAVRGNSAPVSTLACASSFWRLLWTYSEKLMGPRWQRKRLEILQRDGFQCCECGSTTKTLHVHHRYYVSHRMPWEYPPFCYQILCESCHKNIKVVIEERRQEIQQGDRVAIFSEWELGLDHFGEKLFDMAADECCSK